MLFGDYHVHTRFSGDSDESPERVLHKALEESLDEVAFTDHVDPDYPNDAVSFKINLPSYTERLSRLRERWAQWIRIRIGLEVGLQVHVKERIQRLIDYPGLDFVIGSTHCADRQDFWDGSFFRGRARDEAHRIYFETIYDNLRLFDGISVLGHLDFIRRYGAVCYDRAHRFIDYDRQWDVIEAILSLAVQKGVGLEVNTSGYRYGLDQFHPHACILRRYREMGGDIVTIGSDAHRAEDVGRDFREARDLLDCLGFRYVCGFVDKKPVFHPLRSWYTHREMLNVP